MQILWVSQVIPYPPKAGVLIRCYYLLRALARAHEVDLVAFIQEPFLKTFYPDVETGLAECRKALEPFCRSVTFLPIEPLKRPKGQLRTALESLFLGDGYITRWLQGPKARAAISGLARENRYDLAHFDTIALAPYRELLGDVPSTLGHHNVESHMLLRRAEVEKDWLKKAFFSQEGRRLRRYEARVARKFAAHITCSELDNERLREFVPGLNTVCIPNGVDVEFLAPIHGPTRQDSLIFVGTMNWYPNVDAVLFLLREIWPLVIAKRPNATLDIVGAGAPATVTDLAATLPGVTVHGYVPDFRPMIDSAAIYICPVRDGGGTKLKILDALSMAKCIVAHPIACEGIVVTPDKDCIFADAANDFAEKVDLLLRDDVRRATLGSAARGLAVQRYAFDLIGQQLVRVFEGIAQ